MCECLCVCVCACVCVCVCVCVFVFTVFVEAPAINVSKPTLATTQRAPFLFPATKGLQCGAPYVCLLLGCIVQVRSSNYEDLLTFIMVEHAAKVSELVRQALAKNLID